MKEEEEMAPVNELVYRHIIDGFVVNASSRWSALGKHYLGKCSVEKFEHEGRAFFVPPSGVPEPVDHKTCTFEQLHNELRLSEKRGWLVCVVEYFKELRDSEGRRGDLIAKPI
jgi:hypothetical protein